MYQIAIDGHSGSGKSSFAKGLAKALGFCYLNTGEIYRALACAYAERAVGEPTEEKIADFANELDVRINFENGRQIVYVNGKSYTQFLRTEAISELTSLVSVYQVLRDKVLDVQRSFAEENNVIMEGRDITSHVLPNADVKIFLTADVKARAERRYLELPEEEKRKTSLQEVMKDLQERDYRDENRAVAPLIIAKDAIVLDNTNINLQQTIDKGLEIVRSKLKNCEKE